MKLICKLTGVEIETSEEVAKRLIGHGFEEPKVEKPARKKTPRKTKE